MNIENTNNQYRTDWILLGLIAIITIYPFLEVGFTSGDDMMYYDLSFHKNLWDVAFEFAKNNGRFYFALVNPIYTFPYTFDNFIFTKTIQYASLLLCFYVFSVLVKKIFKSTELGMLFLVILLTIISLSKWTSILVCYPFCFCFSFTLILYSVLLLLKYLENGKKKTLIFSAFIYSLGLLFYEVYLVYFLIVAIIIITHYIEIKQQIGSSTFPYKTALKTVTPYLIVGSSYIVVYFIFYLSYPTNYSGNSIATEIKLESILLVLNNFSDPAFPLSVFYENQYILNYQSDLATGYKNDFIYLFMNAKVEWIVKAILACTLLALLVTRLPKITFKKILLGISGALILIYFSHVFLTVTRKYSIEVPHMKGYITTFFSFFGVALLFILLCNLLYNFASRNKFTKIAFISILIAYIFNCSIKTSYSNYYTAQNMAQSKLAFDIIDSFTNWKKFNAIPEESIVYAEDLWKTSNTQIDLFCLGYNWETYIYAKKKKHLYTPRNIELFKEFSNKNPTAAFYYIGKEEAHKTKEAFLLFSPIDSPKIFNNTITPISNSTAVFYYSSYKEFSVSFCMKNNFQIAKKILIEAYSDSTKENYYSFNINNRDKNKASTIFEILAPNIDLKSIVISNILLPNRPTIEVN